MRGPAADDVVGQRGTVCWRWAGGSVQGARPPPKPLVVIRIEITIIMMIIIVMVIIIIIIIIITGQLATWLQPLDP